MKDFTTQTKTSNYSWLLWSLLGLLAFMPFRALHFKFAETASTVLHSLVIISAILSCRERPKLRNLVILLGIPTLVVWWLGLATFHENEYAILTCTLFFYILFMYAIITDLLKIKKVDSNVLAGSLSIYLLSGLIFAYIYTILHMYDANSFLLPDVIEFSGSLIKEGDPKAKYLLPTFIYHSFVTLTTLGYGDIQPQTFSARFLCVFQAVIGQIYLVVVVAGIVGLGAATFFKKSLEEE